MEKEIICIACPLGCRVKITADDNGEIKSFEGNKCKEGKKFVTEEFKSPTRILTATVIIEGSRRALLPVRSNIPIPKDRVRECMNLLATAKVKPSISMEQVIITNILDTGADIIATDELRA